MPTHAPLTLYTFAMSHYSEKIRWTLDACDIPYREVCLSPAFHMLPALRMGGHGQTTLPIIQGDGFSVQDSPRILTWLQSNRGPLAVMPLSIDTDTRAVEQRFNAIGKDVARYLYAGSFGVADEHIVKLWTDHANALQAGVIRASYPLMRWVFKQKLQIKPKRVELARQRIREALDWLDAQLADGRRFLVGDTFTVADITAASLLAPLACPAQHPVYGEPAYREGMRAAVQEWQDRPGIAWVRELYDTQRGAMKGGVF
ncbi:glutathione S-transferase family protein [Aquabacterium parvum]|uniref:glutathione S-transferase family protein n=1 Tax=Aquabacterium parvum TaxID=70584 RepID=UPI000718D4BD|nr:glutathione S-transferase family protein [Aquabacterium parvum]